MKFDNSVLDDLSYEGKSFIGLQLKQLFSSLPNKDTSETVIGLKVKFTNREIEFNSLTGLDLENTVEIRLNCQLFLSVKLHDLELQEYQIEPYHLTTDAFAKLDKLLCQYNSYWKGDSMFVKGGLG